MAPVRRRMFHLATASIFPTIFLFAPRTPLLSR
jgi:hypothetical protein